MLADGQVPYAEASLNKIWWGELRQRICSTGLDLIGEEAPSPRDPPYAPHTVTSSTGCGRRRYGGSAAATNEIQLDIIATRGLGMPR